MVEALNLYFANKKLAIGGQHNVGIRPRVRLEWMINFVGVQTDVPVRVYIDQYYESIPDESARDDFLPTRPRQGHTDVAAKIVHKMSQHVTPVSRTSWSHTAGNVISKIYEYAKPYIGPALIAGASTMGMGSFARAASLGLGMASVKSYRA